MLREIIANPVAMEPDGTIAVPSGSGLGIEINEAAIDRFRVGNI